MDLLVQELQAIMARAPLAYHELAAPLLLAFLGEAPHPEPGDERVPAVVAHTARQDLDERVRGTLFAVLGAWGCQKEIFEGAATDELWRSALIGLGTCPTRRAGIRLPLDEYLRRQPRGGVRILPFAIDRQPDDELWGRLAGEVMTPAEGMEAWLTRDVMLLALGVGVDDREETLALFTRMLFDPSPQMLQARFAILYSLTHASSPAAQEVLRRFLEDDQIGSTGKTLARWWLADRRGLPGDIGLLAAPLFDPSSNHRERVIAAGSLLKRIENATDEELVQIEEITALRALEEEDRTARLAAVTALASTPGGLLRLSTLAQVLQADPFATCRLWAVKGLGMTEGAYREEARAVLRTTMQAEADAGVRDRILQALAELDDGD